MNDSYEIIHKRECEIGLKDYFELYSRYIIETSDDRKEAYFNACNKILDERLNNLVLMSKHKNKKFVDIIIHALSEIKNNQKEITNEITKINDIKERLSNEHKEFLEDIEIKRKISWSNFYYQSVNLLTNKISDNVVNDILLLREKILNDKKLIKKYFDNNVNIEHELDLLNKERKFLEKELSLKNEAISWDVIESLYKTLNSLNEQSEKKVFSDKLNKILDIRSYYLSQIECVDANLVSYYKLRLQIIGDYEDDVKKIKKYKTLINKKKLSEFVNEQHSDNKDTISMDDFINSNKKKDNKNVLYVIKNSVINFLFE